MNQYDNLIYIFTGIVGVFMIIILPTVLGFMWRGWVGVKKTIESNTHALIELKTTIKISDKNIDKIPEIEKSALGAHKRITYHHGEDYRG